MTEIDPCLGRQIDELINTSDNNVIFQCYSLVDYLNDDNVSSDQLNLLLQPVSYVLLCITFNFGHYYLPDSE